MKFAAILGAAAAAVSVGVTGVGASPFTITLDDGQIRGYLGWDLSAGNKYGAPQAPWNSGGKPGWYLGNQPEKFPDLPCLKPGGRICKFLNWLPFQWLHCPTPPPASDGYQQTFSNLTGATQAADYLTYGLVDTITDCKAMCNSVTGCKFINTYHDVNGKGGSTQLTCSLFSLCHDASDAVNRGGQSQPDGSIDYITNSDGFCKA